MTTATAVRVHCNQCFKVFEGATEDRAIRSFKGHATRTGHINQYTVVEDTDVANEEGAEPTNIDAKRAEKEAKAKAKADAAEARKAERAAHVAERETARQAKVAEREAAKAARAAAKAKAAEEKAAARAAAKAEREAPRTTPCECGCGGIPAGRKSRFLPGHDAKHFSAQRETKASAE